MLIQHSQQQFKLTNFYLGAAKPAKVSLKSVKAAKKGKVKVKYKKVSGAAGYQIQYSLKSNMKSAKSKNNNKGYLHNFKT